MAADGSLKFDTRIDTSGFDAGLNTLTKAVDRLSTLVEDLTKKMGGWFGGTGKAAATASRDIDGVADSAKKAASEVERLKKENAATFTGTIDHFDVDPTPEPEREGRYNIYGEDVDELIQKQREREAAAREAAETASEGMEKESQSASGLKSALNLVLEVLRRFPADISGVAQSIGNAMGETISFSKGAGDSMDDAAAKTRNLQDEIDRYKEALYYAEQAGLGLGDKEYDEAYAGLMRANMAAAEYKKALLSVDIEQKKVEKSSRKMSGTMKETASKGAIPLTKSILKLSNMFKLMLIRMAMRAVIDAAREGFENLAQYSDEVNTSLSSLMPSLLYLKNSFAAAFSPILGFVVPALNTMIDALANALGWLGQFMAALTGKNTFIKAKKTQEDWAKSLEKTGKAAGKTQKALASFDDLTLIQDRGAAGGGGSVSTTDPSQMFETVDVDTEMVTMVDRMKATLQGFYGWMAATFGPNLSRVWEGMQAPLTVFKNDLMGIWADIGSLGEPLQNWLNADFVPFLQQLVDTGGFILTGLISTFDLVFTTVWASVIYPFLQSFLTVGLPMITQFGTEVVQTLEPLFTAVQGLFERIWLDAIAPVLEILTEIWTEFMDLLYEVWQEYGHPIFESIREAFQSTGDLLNHIWDQYLQPVFATFMDTVDKLWKNHLKPLVKNFLEFGAKFIQVALDIYNNVVVPLVKWFADVLAPGITAALNVAIKVFGGLLTAVSGVARGILDVLNGVLDFLHTGFSEGWDKAWSSAGDIFKRVFNGIVEMAENAVNYIINGLNKISFDIPDWVPEFLGGGKTFGFNIPNLRLPRLATGTVVPPRAGEFAAILGDNNREAEIVSPVSAMKQAFKEAMAEMRGDASGDIRLTVNLDGKVIYEDVVKRNRQMKDRSGKNPLLV